MRPDAQTLLTGEHRGETGDCSAGGAPTWEVAALAHSFTLKDPSASATVIGLAPWALRGLPVSSQ